MSKWNLAGLKQEVGKGLKTNLKTSVFNPGNLLNHKEEWGCEKVNFCTA